MSAFVAKYDPAGKLLWCTYLGGNNQSMGMGVAVMPDGGVAVAGLTSSDASGPFPTMNPFQAKNNGQSDYFVTVFDASGKIRYSTYLGGSGVEGTPETAPLPMTTITATISLSMHRAWSMSRGRPIPAAAGDQIPGDPECHPERP